MGGIIRIHYKIFISKDWLSCALRNQTSIMTIQAMWRVLYWSQSCNCLFKRVSRI